MAYRMGLLGKKIGMTQSFDGTGACVDLSVVETGPCVVLDVKTEERDGYSAIQLGFGEKRERSTRKPQAGLFAKAETTPKAFIREIRLPPHEASQFTIGQTLTVDQVFRPGEMVDATGISKGKGFQGVIKRHHFGGFKASHGTHEYFRHGGSIGCRLTPGRVVKGKKMSGQMGNKKVTVQNIKVAEVIEDKNLLLLAGAVPGAPDGFLVLRQATKRPPHPVRLEQPAEPPAEPPAETIEAEPPAEA
jgi:large subunit ribosomal protein L3